MGGGIFKAPRNGVPSLHKSRFQQSNCAISLYSGLSVCQTAAEVAKSTNLNPLWRHNMPS